MSHIFGLSKDTNSHFSKQGLAKKQFTKAEAIVEGQRTRKRPYKCGLCEGWHVGGVGKKPKP